VEIVFVHLNSPAPKYLLMNLKSTQKRFPYLQVSLITNHEQVTARKSGLNVFLMSPPRASKDFDHYLKHSKSFRRNFWHSSIARFAYLEEYQKLVSVSLLHIESDVIISGDFPVQKMQDDCHTLCFPIVSRERGIASVFYSPEAKSLTHFVSHCLKFVKREPFGTDMLALRTYFDTFPDRVQALGIDALSRDLNTRVYDPAYVKAQQASFERFEGLFDGAKVGYFFFGSNPWNARGVSFLGRDIENSYMDLSRAKLVENADRAFYDLEMENQLLRMFALHASCKSTKLFDSEQLLKEGYRLKKTQNQKIYFSVQVQMVLRKVLSRLGIGSSN